MKGARGAGKADERSVERKAYPYLLCSGRSCSLHNDCIIIISCPRSPVVVMKIQPSSMITCSDWWRSRKFQILRFPERKLGVGRTKLNSGVHHPSYAFVPPPISLPTTETGFPTRLTTFCGLLIPTEVCGVKSLFRAQRACAHIPCLPLRNNNRWPYVLSSKQVSWNAFSTVVFISSLLRRCRLVRIPAVFTTPWFWWHNLSSPLPPPALLNTTDD